MICITFICDTYGVGFLLNFCDARYYVVRSCCLARRRVVAACDEGFASFEKERALEF